MDIINISAVKSFFFGINDDDIEKSNRETEDYNLLKNNKNNKNDVVKEEVNNSKYSKIKSKNKFKLNLNNDNTTQTRVKKIEYKNELENTIQPLSILSNPNSPDVIKDKVILRESKEFIIKNY
jgi:hypothetical protein